MIIKGEGVERVNVMIEFIKGYGVIRFRRGYGVIRFRRGYGVIRFRKGYGVIHVLNGVSFFCLERVMELFGLKNSL